MQSYKYRARDKRGQLLTGSVDAMDPKEAKRLVAVQGLIPLDVKEAGGFSLPSFRSKAKFGQSKVKIDDLLVFNRQMQIVYSVGIPIVGGLEMIHEQTTSPRMKRAIGQITEDIKQGTSLFEAMSKHSDIFDSIYLNLVKVGEATGDLENLLGRASDMTEERASQRAKVKSATFYPKMVLGFMSLVLLVVVYFVLPKLKGFFTGFGAKLPPITVFVMGVSDFFVSYWYLVAAVAAGAYFGFKAFAATPKGRRLIDSWILKTPIFGPLMLQIEMNTFCVILEILIKSGVTITDSFRLVSESMTNTLVMRDIDACRKSIEKGGSLGAGFRSSKVFPPFVTNLISIGEEGGSLPVVLNRIAAYYKMQVDHKLNNLSKLIEPVLLFMIFGLVLVIALAVFMPMWSMGSQLRK